jgi:hypothetical protein
MTYEKALELKEAGFPMPEVPKDKEYSAWVLRDTFGLAYAIGKDPITEKEVRYTIRLFPGYTVTPDMVYVPTLEEIIEELGPLFGRIVRQGDQPGVTTTFVAYSSIRPNELNIPAYIVQLGETALEAATNLYIALKKK